MRVSFHPMSAPSALGTGIAEDKGGCGAIAKTFLPKMQKNYQ